MGIPLVGERHQRKASTSQATDRQFGAVPNRIRSASGSGCSSANHQQSFQPQKSSSDNREHLVGTLLSRRVASQGDVHARCIQRLCKELDSPTMGHRAAGRNKDCRGGALATSSGSRGWDQGQAQMRDVGFVFTRRPLGVLWSQPDLVGDSGRKWRKERSKHWRARQCETSRSAPVLVTRISETWSNEIRISRRVARVSGGGVRDTSRRTRRPALVGLQLRQRELQRSALVLLAPRRASEGDKNGSVGKSVADASGAERCVAGMEVAERLQRSWGFRFPVPSPQREEATGPCRRSQTEDPTGFFENRHHRRGLAYVSAHGRDYAGGDGRTSTHDPRLLASQQSSCDQQVSSSNTGAQAPGARKTSRCYLAGRFVVGEQINSHSVAGAGERVLAERLFQGNAQRAECLEGLLDPNGP